MSARLMQTSLRGFELTVTLRGQDVGIIEMQGKFLSSDSNVGIL